jgi:hypothetical protein
LLGGRPNPTRAGLAAGMSIIGGGGVKDALGAATPALGLTGFGIPGLLGLGGTKPKALHTEYAKTSANWQKPYGSGTDIIFYLKRADQGSSEGSAGEGTTNAAGSGSSLGASPSNGPVSGEGRQALVMASGGYVE